MTAPLVIRVKYVGPDDPEMPRFPASRTKIIATIHGPWEPGEEMLPIRPGLCVLESENHTRSGPDGDVHRTFTVSSTPPPTGEATDERDPVVT